MGQSAYFEHLEPQIVNTYQQPEQRRLVLKRSVQDGLGLLDGHVDPREVVNQDCRDRSGDSQPVQGWCRWTGGPLGWRVHGYTIAPDRVAANRPRRMVEGREAADLACANSPTAAVASTTVLRTRPDDPLASDSAFEYYFQGRSDTEHG
jgi:hypothetical protein